MNARTLPRHAESTILSDARTLLETIYADAIMDSNLVRSRKSVKVINVQLKKPREKTMKYFNYTIFQATVWPRPPKANTIHSAVFSIPKKVNFNAIT